MAYINMMMNIYCVTMVTMLAFLTAMLHIVWLEFIVIRNIYEFPKFALSKTTNYSNFEIHFNISSVYVKPKNVLPSI